MKYFETKRSIIIMSLTAQQKRDKEARIQARKEIRDQKKKEVREEKD